MDEQTLISAIKNAEGICLIPLLKLIYINLGINLSKEYKLKNDISDLENNKSGEIDIKDKDGNIVKVYLDVVDKNWDFINSLNNSSLVKTKIDNINDLDDNLKKVIIQSVTHLTQSALLIFNNIKGEQLNIGEYHINMSNNTTLFINDSETHIGIIFKNYSESE